MLRRVLPNILIPPRAKIVHLPRIAVRQCRQIQRNSGVVCLVIRRARLEWSAKRVPIRPAIAAWKTGVQSTAVCGGDDEDVRSGAGHAVFEPTPIAFVFAVDRAHEVLL
jgi:hypothetical protein